MITKQDVSDYFDQLETKILKLEKFYDQLYSEVNDINLKEMFLRLKCEEKVHLELIQRLKEIFKKEWKE